METPPNATPLAPFLFLAGWWRSQWIVSAELVSPAWGRRRILRLRPLHALLAGGLLGGVLGLLTLGGCGGTGPSVSSMRSPTSSPVMTASPQPVELAITLRQEGTVEGHSLKLIATATLTNHLGESVGVLTQTTTPYPFI